MQQQVVEAHIHFDRKYLDQVGPTHGGKRQRIQLVEPETPSPKLPGAQQQRQNKKASQRQPEETSRVLTSGAREASLAARRHADRLEATGQSRLHVGELQQVGGTT